MRNRTGRRDFLKQAGMAASGIGIAAVPAIGAAAASPSGNAFAQKVVAITGATSGIGEATARAFAKKGAVVAFCGRRKALGEQVVSDIIKEGGQALYVQADVREEKQIEQFYRTIAQEYGAIHIAFNNAGVVFGRGSLTGNAPLADIQVEDFDDVWKTNTRGIFLSMKYQMPYLLQNDPWGRYGLRGVVINTSSISAHGGFPGIGPYSVSKHGVSGLTKNLALDYGKQGIRVLAISPGGVDTPMRRASIAAQGRDPDDNPAPNMQYRTNTVEEMADLVLYLSNPDSPSSLQGTDIDCTMGMLTGPFAPPK